MKIWISEVGKCPRVVFFKFKRAPAEEIDPERLRIFEDGHWLQQKILRPLFSYGMVRATEIPIPENEIVAGKADAIISDSFGIPYVLEIKSVSGKMNFEKLDPHRDFEHHIAQIQLYLHFFKIKKGFLLYINKDTQELKEFLIEYDPEKIKSLLEWCYSLKEKIELDIVPESLKDWPQNWECQRCLFSEICKMAGRNEIEWAQLKEKFENIEALKNQKENS